MGTTITLNGEFFCVDCGKFKPIKEIAAHYVETVIDRRARIFRKVFEVCGECWATKTSC